MPPKQPPTLKPISSDSSSDSEDNESQPVIQSKSVTKKELIKSDSDSDTKTKETNETKTKESKPDNITLLLNIVNQEKELLKNLSELQKEKETLVKSLKKKSEKKTNKETKPREPQKPLDEIPPVIKKFIKCDDDAKFTMMELSQQLRKQLIINGKEQIITKSQLTELKINEKDRKELELEEVNKEELKEDISKQLTDKKEKYYVVKFGKLLSIVSFILKQ